MGAAVEDCSCIDPDKKCPSGRKSGSCSTVIECSTITTCYGECDPYTAEKDESKIKDAGVDTDKINKIIDKIKVGDIISKDHFEILGKYLSKVADLLQIDEDYENPSLSTGDKIKASHAEDSRLFLKKLAEYSEVNAADPLLTLNNISFEVGKKIEAKTLKDFLEIIDDVAKSCRCVSDSINNCKDQCYCDCHY